MKRKVLFLLAFTAVFSRASDDVVFKPLNIGALEEFGSVQNGLYSSSNKGELTTTGHDNVSIGDMEWVDHFGAFISQEAVVNGRLHLSGGFGGVFQFRKPEVINTDFHSSQGKAFFIGPTQTEAVYHFGDPEKPWLKLGVGMFPYKYNPEAVNLGEYLFRATPYPTTMTTGGYAIVNSAAAVLEGFKANFQRGNFKLDALLITETTFAPFYDWSPAFVGEFSAAGGLLDLGAGVKFHRLIPVKPSRSTPKVEANSYLTNSVTGKSYVGIEDQKNNFDYYYNSAHFYLDRGTHSDSIKAQSYIEGGRVRDSLYQLPDSLPPGLGGRPDLKYFTSRGILLMARATLDAKKFFDASMLGPEDLKIFAEVDILGVEDYPIYYSSMMDRMPVMMGVNLPGFHWLDLFVVQAEYFHPRWANNTFFIGNGDGSKNWVINTPYLPAGTADDPLSKNDYNDQSGSNHWKWSLLAKKTIRKRLKVSVQVANDHLRLPSSLDFYGPNFEPNEITAFKNSWYWMTQFSWGI